MRGGTRGWSWGGLLLDEVMRLNLEHSASPTLCTLVCGERLHVGLNWWSHRSISGALCLYVCVMVNEWVCLCTPSPQHTHTRFSIHPLFLSVMLLRYFHSLSPALFLPPSCAIGCTAWLPLLLCLSRRCTFAGCEPSPFLFFSFFFQLQRDKDSSWGRGEASQAGGRGGRRQKKSGGDFERESEI